MKKYGLIILVALISGLTGGFVFNYFYPKQEIFVNNTQYPSVGFASTGKANLSQVNEDFANASAISTPSVVYITTLSSRYDNSNWFDWYFNGRSSQSISSGSGVIFSNDGYIITNSHVINNAEKIEVIHEKKTYEARLVGKDPSTDLAVLKIDGQNLPAIKLGSSQNLRVGEWVLAVGNPFNLTSTVTAGIVSAKARNIHVVNSQFPIESFIQTDAAINPGNSGGALVNIKGELVGINTAILSQTGSYAGYGFAVPIDIVAKVVKDIIKYGEVQKAFFGADVTDINDAIAKELNLSDLTGVAVTYLEKDGAAEKSGILKGDIIIRLNDYNVLGKSHFDEFLSYFSPGDKIKVIFKRDGKVSEGTVVLTNREGTTEILRREIVNSEKLGADMETISKVEKSKYHIENGVRILNIKNGFFRRIGMDDGFIIMAINGRAVKSPSDVEALLQNARGKVTIEGIGTNGVRGYYSFFF